MINLADYIPVKKNKVQSILKVLKRIGKKSPEIKGFYLRSEKNNRGGYGYMDIYSYNGKYFLIVDIDGARLDVRYFVSGDVDAILKSMAEV
jgi:hypothetical protein